MKEGHYFQRYSQRENWATNSTILLFSRLYHESTSKFSNFVNTLFAESGVEIDIGVRFFQQVKAKNSVPDAIISQADFQIIIENKLYDNFDVIQLEGHLSAFDQSTKTKVLVGLSKSKPSDSVSKQVLKTIRASKSFRNVSFVGVTYRQICEAFRASISPYDFELQEILDDYYDLCLSERLVANNEQRLLAVTARWSVDENRQFGIYYDPADRNNNIPFNYIGLYENKTVVAIGKVETIVACDLVKGTIIAKDEAAKSLTEGQKERIKGIIQATDYYEISSGHKFYLVEKFYETDYRKTSFGGIRAKKYFNLTEALGIDQTVDASEIAARLRKETWE